MAEGKEQYEWNFWASYLAIFANCNRDPKKHRPFTPQDFHPFATAKRNAVEACDLNGHMRAWKEAAERQRLGLKR